ncbi:MAG: glycosyltransferase family 9 protein [Puia sp.]
MQKFLIIQTAFIGDVVLATVLIEKLHDYFPDAEIDFLLRKGNEQLLTGHPFLHEILIWDKKQDKQKNLLRMLKRIRRNKYDKVINVQRFFATGFLAAFSGAKETIGFDKNPLSFLFSKKSNTRSVAISPFMKS